MIANINEQLWIDFDLDTAVFLDTIAYWIKKNAANKQPRNFKDGRYWTYNTQESFQKMFPGWKRESIRRIIRNCLKNNLIIVGNYNTKSYDRTSWFSLTDIALKYYPSLAEIIGNSPDNTDGEPLVGFNIPLVGSNPAIPTLLPSVNNNNIIKRQPLIDVKELIAIYHEELPDSKQSRIQSLKLLQRLRTVQTDWPRYSSGKPFSLESFRKYLRVLKEHASFLIKPYETKFGNIRKNGIELFIRDDIIAKVLNGDFNK